MARLTEGQKELIKGNIFQPMERVIPKVTLFETVDRALLMLNNSLKQLKFDRKQFEARIVIEDQRPRGFIVKVEARAKTAPDDIMTHEVRFGF